MQKLFNKILVPVDFTERSEKAVEKAGEIAAQFNCSVYLLHVRYLSPLERLEKLDISNTDIKTGLKYLPVSCYILYCNSEGDKKSARIAETLSKYSAGSNKYYIGKWKEDI